MRVIEEINASIENFWETLTSWTLGIFPIVILVVISILAAFLIGFLFRVFARITKFDRWLDQRAFFKAIHTSGSGIKTHILIGRFVFAIVLICFLEVIASMNGWVSLKDSFLDFSLFLPSMISATLIITVGVFLAKYLKRSAELILEHTRIKSAKIIAKVFYYGILLFIIIIALNHVGVNTAIITANTTIIFGSVLLAFSISFVFASKNILTNILSSSYNKSTYKVGQMILVNGIKGEIIKITNLSVYIKTSDHIKIIPARKFTEEVVDILG